MSDRFAKTGLNWTGTGFPLENGFGIGTGLVQLERDRDRDGTRPVGTGPGSGQKNFVPPDPTDRIYM
jgi:hypothetical protein